MSSTTSITLVNGVQVVVPDTLNLITSYVLKEQRDWFEDEIKFLRHLLKPAQKVVDIGANYGVYTLSMAQTVGPTGCVWAFEPASNTARLLAEGIAKNGFRHIILDQSALSNHSGKAQLSLNANSELNSLIYNKHATGDSETVSLVTLDQCMERYGWKDIDFIKIDAEGEESNILRGGKQFFEKQSPLVQYEIKAGQELHLGLIQEFRQLGYHSYRLVPGLNLLIPFDLESAPDGYLLNLFCCKQDRMKQLAVDGFMLASSAHKSDEVTSSRETHAEGEKINDPYNWKSFITKFPYGNRFASTWEKTMANGKNLKLSEAIVAYAKCCDTTLSSSERFRALEDSFNLFKYLCEHQPNSLHLSSMARVARDYGARTLAVKALKQLSDTIFQSRQVDLSTPFLTSSERFESIPPDKMIGKWILASILEDLERLGHFSSFYAGPAARKRLEAIHNLGYGSKEMDRRLDLIQQRFGTSGS